MHCCLYFSVRITTAQFPLPAICAKDQIEDWFDRLAECLHWNVRKQQRSLMDSRNVSETNFAASNGVNGTGSYISGSESVSHLSGSESSDVFNEENL